MLRGWDIVLGRFKTKWNVFAIDLKNEPYGVATWGTSESLFMNFINNVVALVTLNNRNSKLQRQSGLKDIFSNSNRSLCNRQ